MKLTDLKKQLNAMDQKKLVAMICKLYKGGKQAQSIIAIKNLPRPCLFRAMEENRLLSGR